MVVPFPGNAEPRSISHRPASPAQLDARHSSAKSPEEKFETPQRLRPDRSCDPRFVEESPEWDEKQLQPEPVATRSASRARVLVQDLPPAEPGRRMLDEVAGFFASNPADASAAGSSLFRGDSPTTRAIKTFISERCEGAFMALAHSAVRDAAEAIEKERASPLCCIAGRDLNPTRKQQILVRHLARAFLDGNGGPRPMELIVPVEVRAFLRELRDLVSRWAQPAGLARASADNVVPGSLILRGASAWIIAHATSRDLPGESRNLYLDLSRMLMSISTPNPYRPPVDASGAVTTQGMELAAAVDRLKPYAQEVFDAIVA